jgi:putative peptide zinc metalloprotease protein
MAKLRVLQGPDLGRRMIELDKPETVFGRFADCDVVFPTPAMSRRHFKIVREANGWSVEDLRSRGGVYVNDMLAKGPTPLHDGDQIRVCDSVLVFIDDGGS